MNAAVYARLSSGDDAGIEKQTSIARDFIAEKGWTIDPAHVYTDDGVSGAKLSRPGLDRMLQAMELKARPFGAIVTMSGDRLSRGELHETLGLMHRITQAGVEVWSYISKTLDAYLTPEDQLIHGVKGYGYMKYRKDVAAKTRSKLQSMKADGYATGPAAYGTRLEPKGPHKIIVPDETTAPTVLRIFTLAAEGYGSHRIAGTLRGEHRPAPRGAWSPTGIKKVLGREAYRGLVVPDAVYDTAVSRMKATSAAYARTVAGRIQSKPESKLAGRSYVGTGYLKCSECGANVIVIEAGRSYVCSAWYKRKACSAAKSKRHSRAAVDAQIRERLNTMALDFESAVSYARDFNVVVEEPERRDAERAALTVEVSSIKGELARLVDVISKGISTAPTIVQAIERKEAELSAVQARLEHVDGQTSARAFYAGEEFREAYRTLTEQHRFFLEGKGEPTVAVQRAILARKGAVGTLSPEGEVVFEVTLWGPADADLVAQAERAIAGAKAITGGSSGERGG